MHPVMDKIKWRTAHEAAVRAIQRVEDAELRAPTDDDVWRIIKTPNAAGPLWEENTNWSGLAEMHAILHRQKGRPITDVNGRTGA